MSKGNEKVNYLIRRHRIGCPVRKEVDWGSGREPPVIPRTAYKVLF